MNNNPEHRNLKFLPVYYGKKEEGTIIAKYLIRFLIILGATSHILGNSKSKATSIKSISAQAP
jgi:hypothetical protein